MSGHVPASWWPGGRDRSRSPQPRFVDRRASAAFLKNRDLGPARNAPEAPRGPRSQFDGPRGLPPRGPSPGPPVRGGFVPRGEVRELRDAPPLGSDRGRAFKDRDCDRRDSRPLPPRERSPPPRDYRDVRDYQPRDIDIGRARRASRDGPPSAGSTYFDAPPFVSAPFSRGDIGSARGRGRGDFGYRALGARRLPDDRDLFRPRERSPPPRWPRELSREGRESERRDDRRFDRRESDRRPEWIDREREQDRFRRDHPSIRLDSRHASESQASVTPSYQPPAASNINPDRLALLESTRDELDGRRPPSGGSVTPNTEARREPPQQLPAYLDGRAEATNNRYGPRASTPPPSGMPVPAFGSVSFNPSFYPAPPSNVWRAPQDPKPAAPESAAAPAWRPAIVQNKAETSMAASTMAQSSEPPISAPKAPRALDAPSVPQNMLDASGGRLHGVRTWDSLKAPAYAPSAPSAQRSDPHMPPKAPALLSHVLPAKPQGNIASLNAPVSPLYKQTSRLGDISVPTGPKASRASFGEAQIPQRPPLASPRFENQYATHRTQSSLVQTPPSAAPAGPRATRSFSVSPKVMSSNVPTAPKSSQPPPIAPRGPERGLSVGPRPPDRPPQALQPWAPPVAPRGASQWNQWHRQGTSLVVPAKRDFHGDDKPKRIENASSFRIFGLDSHTQGDSEAKNMYPSREETGISASERINVDKPAVTERRTVEQRNSLQEARSAKAHEPSAAQSFVGKPLAKEQSLEPEEEEYSERDSSEEDDMGFTEADAELNEAKFEREKKRLEAQLIDLSHREYRATTPLEHIARVARISAKDMPDPGDRMSDVQDEDGGIEPHMCQPELLPEPVKVEDLLTPRADASTGSAARSAGSGQSLPGTRKQSPEPINLPYLPKRSSTRLPDLFGEAAPRDEGAAAMVRATLQEKGCRADVEQQESMNTFVQILRVWKEHAEDLDRTKEEEERIERQQSLEPQLPLEASIANPGNTHTDGRRLHKFSSEYEIEQVIKQSEETARLEQEKIDRETKKAQADLEKEARIPDQHNNDLPKRWVFLDTNRLREPTKLTTVFAYEPPADTFTEKEDLIFTQAFRETPKKWGEIASLLPGRTYQDCIHHYYAFKWDGRFRDKGKKLGKRSGGRGRGGKANRGRIGAGLMADFGRQDDFMPPIGVNEKGRPKRAAAPTTFGERDADARATTLGPSPAKKLAAASRQDGNGEAGHEKPTKRRRGGGTGERGGRKGKAQPPAALAALAAAPSASPLKLDGQTYRMHDPIQDDVARTSEDASLLLGLQGGHHGMLPNGQLVYTQETFTQSVPVAEEIERSKQTTAQKPAASSYWSVPEQNDFVKFIAHFGTDFAAIAAHMGTKTQTMVKNHYTRFIDSGTRQDLEDAAMEANQRRGRGEDMGQPPVPTPIVKRRYDNPQTAAQRPIAPQSEPMEIDDAGPPAQAPTPKHASPQQYQPVPRFTPSALSTPVPAQRAAPTSLPLGNTSTTPSSAAPPTAGPPQPPGPRMGFFRDSRSESGQSSMSSAFRPGPPPQRNSNPGFGPQSAPDDSYIMNLKQERDRALQLQLQEIQAQQERVIMHQSGMHQMQRSPAQQTVHMPLERKISFEERTSTPLQGSLPISRPLLGSIIRNVPDSPVSGPLAPDSLSLAGRSAFNPSPPTREAFRPNSMPVSSLAQSPGASVPLTEAPKRSNIMSILNSGPEEPKPKKRFSEQGVSNLGGRTESPAQKASAPPPQLSLSLQHPRRETFGQPSMPQSQFQRTSILPQSQAAAPPPPTLKHELPSGGGPMQHPPKLDWTARIFPPSLSTNSVPQQPAFERDVRPYFNHRSSILGSLNGQPRANPSPPPQGIIHSRTPSYTASAPGQASRDQRPLSQQQQQSQQPQQQAAHVFQPNPYAPQAPPQSRVPQVPGQQQNHAHHHRNSSAGGAFPNMQQRHMSRDAFEQQEQQRQQDEHAQHMRLHEDMQREVERQRQAQRQQEQAQRQQEREWQFSRGPPPTPQPMHPPRFADSRPIGLREQAAREAEEIRAREELLINDRRRQEQEQIRRLDIQNRYDEDRRRHDESLRFGSRTPLGGFGGPGQR